MQTSWEAKPPVDDARSTLRAQHDSSADRNSWNFVEDRRLPVDVLYRMSNHRDYEFDRELGTIRKVTTDLKTAWPPGREPTSDKQTFELTGTRQLGAAELRALSDEADCYWTAMADYKKLVSRADTEPGSAIGWFEKGESILKQLSGQITLPSLQAMLDRKLSQHRQDRAYMLPQYHRAAAILGKPSPDWQTTDLDGKPHALTDYRGKVVMLDFWIPGCGWCVRAMPQIKQLVADFEGQDVAIFGVNRDQNEQEARFVIETMKLNYNTLNDLHGSARISSQYKIITYPSLLLVDRKGIVRHVRLSYSPTLRQDVGENIRGLLAEKEQ